MTRAEIDILWQRAMQQAVKDGEMFTRYRFATLVAAAEREACAKVCEAVDLHNGDHLKNSDPRVTCAAAIRARSNP